MVEIIPTILTSDSSEAREIVARCEGVVERVQVDIIDGVFADNKTIDPTDLKNLSADLKLDFHLMVKEPVEWIGRCVEARSDRIIGHIEMMGSQKEFVEEVKEVKVGIGLAVDLNTPISKLDLQVLGDVDVVLVMSVKAGFGGQEFEKSVIEKIKRLSELRKRNNSKYRICVDGGITDKNIKSVVEAGAGEVSVGRRLFKGGLKGNIERYKKILIYE